MTILIQPLSAQESRQAADSITFADLAEQAYGLDQGLVNGFDYYNRYTGCKGDPYFMEGDFRKGTIHVHGQEYPEVRLRYDIASQLVEMEYTNSFGGNSWMIIIADHVGAFLYGDYQFRKMKLEGQSAKFYQVIRTSRFTCYVYWEKRQAALQNDSRFSSQFTNASATCLLEMNGKLAAFKNKNDLVALFPAEQQKEIKRLLKRERFLVHNVTPPELVRSMTEVANLLKSGGLP